MRFGVRLPGPFFATFGRSAKSQARRNLQVRAWELQLLAEAPMRAARHRARVRLFCLAVAVVVPVALADRAGSALMGQRAWTITWVSALMVCGWGAIGYWIARELRAGRARRIGYRAPKQR